MRLLDPDNFQLSLVGLPFWLAACALAAVLVYALFMRGAPHLRAPIIVFAGGLLPFVVGFGLAVAAPTDDAARGFFRFGTAFVPIAAVGATVFELALAERLSSYRAVIALASAVAVGFMIVALATPWAVAGVVHTPSGLRFFAAGPAVAPAVAIITACSVAAFVETLRAARAAAPGLRRRQLWGGLVALAVSFLGLVDVLLAFGIGYLPVSWFFVAVGALLALRSIFQDDLLRARALDGRAPLAFFALVVAFALVAAVAVYLLDGWPAWVGALIILEAILGARVLLALVGRAWAVRAPGAGPLDRVASQFATRVREAERAGQVAALAGDACHIGLGDAVTVIIPARDDWSWQTADHEVLVGDQIPDPLLGPWLAAYRQPLSSTDLDAAGLDDLRPSAERLFTAFAATGLVPLVVRDELVGLIIIRGRPLGPRQARFLAGIADRTAAALDYVRIAETARARAELVHEVELAAAVQAGFVPGPEPVRHGGLTVVGSWQPAAACGGDWWSRYPLSGGRTLVVVGDVTGTGVASAMVTAAARGACDAAVAGAGDALDVVTLLGLLDAAVRQVGAGRFHLTCFASIVDPAAGTVLFANAGHLAPYVCRPRPTPTPTGDTIELSALVARGNPLGAGAGPVAKVATRPLADGDLVVWYTDGLIECHGADGKQFGDRRLQRVLRRLAEDERDPVAVQRRLAGELVAHLGGLPIDDDMTLVVARVERGAQA